jgi:hypothetical protein
MDDGCGLFVSKLELDLEIVNVALECWSCTSASVGAVLPQVVAVIRESSTTIWSLHESLLGRSLHFFGWTYSGSIVDRLAAERGATKWPSSPAFAYSPNDCDRLEPWSLSDLPSLSTSSIDALLFGGIVALHSLMIVTTQSHLDNHSTSRSIASSTTVSSEPPIVGSVDVTDLNATVGSWAEAAMDSLRNITEWMSVTTEFGAGGPGINALNRKVANALWRIEMPWNGGTVMMIMNTIFALRHVQIGGPVSLLQPVPDRPHTMNNSISIGINARPVIVTADIYAHL